VTERGAGSEFLASQDRRLESVLYEKLFLSGKSGRNDKHKNKQALPVVESKKNLPLVESKKNSLKSMCQFAGFALIGEG
jgi:hypothetical protein